MYGTKLLWSLHAHAVHSSYGRGTLPTLIEKYKRDSFWGCLSYLLLVPTHTSAWEVTQSASCSSSGSSSVLFTPLRERWPDFSRKSLSCGWFLFTPLRERWHCSLPPLPCRATFLFTPLRERWRITVRRFMSVGIRFYSHLCMRGDNIWHTGALMLLCFHSHLCARGDDNLPASSGVSLRFYSHLCVRGDPCHPVVPLKLILVSIHTSAWEVTRFSDDWELYFYVSIHTSEWEVTRNWILDQNI